MQNSGGFEYSMVSDIIKKETHTPKNTPKVHLRGFPHFTWKRLRLGHFSLFKNNPNYLDQKCYCDLFQHTVVLQVPALQNMEIFSMHKIVHFRRG